MQKWDSFQKLQHKIKHCSILHGMISSPLRHHLLSFIYLSLSNNANPEGNAAYTSPYHCCNKQEVYSLCQDSPLQSWLQQGDCLIWKIDPISSSAQPRKKKLKKMLRWCNRNIWYPSISSIRTNIGRCKYASLSCRWVWNDSWSQFKMQSTSDACAAAKCREGGRTKQKGNIKHNIAITTT